jgi:hypothetical protein
MTVTLELPLPPKYLIPVSKVCVVSISLYDEQYSNVPYRTVGSE